MKRLALLCAALGLTACNASPVPLPPTSLSTVEVFGRSPTQDVGGWKGGELLIEEGASIPFVDGAQASGRGLVIFPGVADGKRVPFVITDVWWNLPDPWLQPVWSPQIPGADRPADVRNVFAIGVDGTFYSPYWQLEFLFTPNLTSTTFRSARQILKPSVPVERKLGPVVLCPVVPPDVDFVNDGAGPRDPATLALLPNPPGKVLAWFEGEDVQYFSFGIDRVPVENLRPVEARAFFFVADDGKTNLPLAAVLPSDPIKHAWVKRVTAKLPPGSVAYVPPSRTAVRARLEAAGVALSPSDAPEDVQYALRVATSPACFTSDGGFPSECGWLDSAAAMEALPAALLSAKPINVTLGMLEVTP